MRVLYVCADPGIPVGATKGASTHVAELVRALRAEGHDVHVVARRVDSPGAAVPLRVPGEALRRRVLRGPLATLRAPAESRPLRRQLARAVEQFRPDVVYERYSLWRSETEAVARRFGVPLVLEVNAPLADEAARFRRQPLVRLARRVEHAVWRGAHLVVVPSTGMARRVRAVGQQAVLVVPNAVDPDRFAPDDGAAVRERLGLADRFVVGFVGSLKPWHDLRTLVDAVAALPAQLRACLLVVGDGPERQALEARARSAGISCVSVGSVAHHEVPSYVAAADVCVATLLADPELDYFSPLKAVEYLAMGRPTVVAQVGDLNELVAADVAVGYRAEDASSLASALAALAGDPARRAQLAEAGRRYVATRTWQAAARHVLAAIRPSIPTPAVPARPAQVTT